MGYFLQDSQGRQFPIGLCMWIGFDSSSQISLSNTPISPCHAILGDYPDGLLLRDEDSATGTYVNNEVIDQVVALKVGDELSFRNFKFVVGKLETSQTERVTGTTTIRTAIPTQTQSAANDSSGQDQGKNKSDGCLKNGLVMFLIFMAACAVLGGTAYLLEKNGLIPRRMVELAPGGIAPQVNAFNFTGHIGYVYKAQKFQIENAFTIPGLNSTLEPCGSESALIFTAPGKKEFLPIETTRDGDERGYRHMPDADRDREFLSTWPENMSKPHI